MRRRSSGAKGPQVPSTGKVRIIGGNFRRRIVHFPAMEGVRPTPDRVRETLFNWLGQMLEGWHVLDLFAGSGALSLEALSRGASEVTAIESNSEVAKMLAENARLLSEHQSRTPDRENNTNIIVLNQDARIALTQLPEQHFDLIFADPPFGEIDDWLPILLNAAERLLHPDGWLYLESPHRLEPPTPWHMYRHATAGQVCYHLWCRNQSDTG